MCEFTGAKVALTIATHPAKHNSSVRRVKSVRKRSKMVTRSRIRISDQDEVGDSDNNVLLSIANVNYYEISAWKMMLSNMFLRYLRYYQVRMQMNH